MLKIIRNTKLSKCHFVFSAVVTFKEIEESLPVCLLCNRVWQNIKQNEIHSISANGLNATRIRHCFLIF